MSRACRFALLVVVLALACATVAHANDSEIGVLAGDAYPLDSTSVRMDSESVQVVCLEDYALYRIDFKFVNETDATQSVRLGFPFVDFSPKGATEVNRHRAQGFHAWFNGEPIPVSEIRGKWPTGNGVLQPAVWFAHDVEFPPGPSMVTVYYTGAAGGSVAGGVFEGVDLPGDRDDASFGMFPYQVSSGAGWKGRIRKSVVRFTMDPQYQARYVEVGTRNFGRMYADKPPVWVNAMAQPEPNVFQWTYLDYEPGEGHDMTVVWPALYDDELVAAGTWLESSAWYAEPREGEYGFLQLAMELVCYDPWLATDRGPEVGASTTYRFTRQRSVRQIRVVCTDDYDAIQGSRLKHPKRLRVDFSDGTTRVLELAEGTGMQFFPVRAKASTVKVTLLDVYEGDPGASITDIPHIEFGTRPAPRFTSFEKLTGIDPAPAFKEPAALRSPDAYPVAPFRESYAQGRH